MQSIGLDTLSPAQRARVIYTQARSEMNERLWQAAIGGQQDARFDAQTSCRHGAGLPAMGTFAPLVSGHPIGRPVPVPVPDAPFVAKAPRTLASGPLTAAVAAVVGTWQPTGILSGLGANSAHATALHRAAERSAIPAPALAAIVDAEAAKRPDGSWNLLSRNPRSSAAGLGQFLSGTWIGMAEQKGNWLHDLAGQKGWLDAKSRVRPESKGSLLALRYDAEASINTTADYARSNIDMIRKAGIRTSDDPQTMAKLAYLGHHLGPGDAIRYLNGGLSERRAAHLLKAQIGSGRAAESISRTGDAAVAHRNWLNGYVTRNIRPDRFAAADDGRGA